MGDPLIKKIYQEFKDTKKFTLPDALLPFEKGVNLVAWARELYTYYDEEAIVVRPFDELPPIRLSREETLPLTIQDVHKFIINDLNLIPVNTRKHIFAPVVASGSATDAWERTAPILVPLVSDMDRETLMEELSWQCGPISEVLWALSWFFMELEKVSVPDTIQMVCSRFPYYRWQARENVQSMWEPEPPVCRREWLAFDLYNRVITQDLK